MEMKKVDDLSYRSTIAVNLNMSDFTAGENARYNKNTPMLSEKIPSGGRFYPMLDFSINYEDYTWKENPVNVDLLGVTITPAQFSEFNSVHTLNTEMVPERETDLINDLFPPDESVFFYSNCKSAPDEKSRVQRSFTFGRDNDNSITVNPYNTVPVYGIEPVFASGNRYRTFGLESITYRLNQIQTNIGNYADSIIGDVLELLKIDQSGDISKTFMLINTVLKKRATGTEVEGQDLLMVLPVNADFYNVFREALLNSDTVAYYGSSMITSKQKEDFVKKHESGTAPNDSLRKILLVKDYRERMLYYFNEDLPISLIEQTVIESVLDILTIGRITVDETAIDLVKKRIEVAIRLISLVNGLNRTFKRMLDSIITNQGERKVLSPNSTYDQLVRNASGLIRRLESVYTAGLQIGNHFLWNLDNEITHRRAKISPKPTSGKLIFLSNPLLEDILMEGAQNQAKQERRREYIADEGGLIEYGETKFTKTKENNIEGKSLVFKIPDEMNAGNECEMTFFLLKARGLNYNTSSCLITFEKVAVTIGDKCFDFHSPYTGLTPYYYCHYIHSMKDSDSSTCSAIRLELLPDTNIPGAAKKDILPQESVLNTVCSRVYYIPVSSFKNYNVKIGEMYRDNNDLVTNIESLNGRVRVQLSVDKNFHVCIKSATRDDKDFTNEFKGHENVRFNINDNDLISASELDNFGTLEEKEEIANTRTQEMKPKKLSKKKKDTVNIAERLDSAALGQLKITLTEEDVQKNSEALFKLFGKKKDEK